MATDFRVAKDGKEKTYFLLCMRVCRCVRVCMCVCGRVYVCVTVSAYMCMCVYQRREDRRWVLPT